MRIPFPVHVVLATLAIFAKPALAIRNITVDNLDSLINYSPIPCFRSPPPNCSPEWQLIKSSSAFNGTTTNTNSTAVANGLGILPRLTFTFQGSSILFVPGQDSNATATVVVDDLASVLVDTAHNAFSGTDLDPSSFHTITITYNPPTDHASVVLSIDYFVIGQPESNTTSTTSTSTSAVLTPAPLPISTTTTSTTPTFSATLAFPPPAFPTPSSQSQTPSSSRPATGTIAAISLSGALILLIGGMGWLFTAQRRRRKQRAFMREAEILQDTRLPSGVGLGEGTMGLTPAQRYSMGITAAEGEAAGMREPGDRRTSVPPPVHYTPWRS